ncbi:hypothetical protein [Mycolicibacterium agri]|nr:hypothetical protein [Mycolicibacterium agri]
MTGLVESTTAGETEQRSTVQSSAQPPESGGGWFAAIDGWRGIGWLSCGAAGGFAIGWFILLAPGEVGSKADWFFGAGVLCLALVSLWQTASIQRQANQRAAAAAERLRTEVLAAHQRMARELDVAKQRHKAELESQQKLHAAELESQQKRHEADLQSQQRLHRAELDGQHRQAQTEHRHLRNQLQRQAIIEVSRSVGEHTQALATLWDRGASILTAADRSEREQAMRPIFEQIGQVVHDFSIEIANAHRIVDDDRLHQALTGVNEAVLMAIGVAQDVSADIVDGRTSQPDRISQAQRLMQERAAEARRLAWDLLRSGLDDAAE